MKGDIIIEYLNRASVLYLIAAILSAIIVLGGLIIYLVYIPQDFPELENQIVDNNQNIIESLTAPDGGIESISKELQDSLTAPKTKNKASQDILDSLTVPK